VGAGGGRHKGEMTQTLYAHMNKRNKNFFSALKNKNKTVFHVQV
jgi:hypothetical protein